MDLFPRVMDGSFSGGVAPPSSSEKSTGPLFPDPRLWLSEANAAHRPAEVCGTEHYFRRSAPASGEPMPGVTDEEYIQAAEFCRKTSAFSRSESEKAAWLTLSQMWLGLVRDRAKPVRGERKGALADHLDQSENGSQAK
jgi:hypothetical protein